MHESEKWKWSHSVVSDSLRSHRLQPTRLLHPWDFLGKSTGLVCHCLLLKLIWWCWILLFIFSSSIQPLIPPSNLNENFAGKNILGHRFSNNPPITPIFLPRQSLRQKSLVGYSPWDHKELDMMEATWHGTAQVLPFLTLNISCHSIRPAEFLLRNHLTTLWEFPCILSFFTLLHLMFFLCQFSSIWLLYVLVCSSLGLSCLKLSTHPVLGCLFPFSCEGGFQLLSLQISGMCVIWILMPLMLSQRSL